MRILGIDPGFERLGIAILEKEKGSKEMLVFSECFKTPKTIPFSERLAMLGTRIKEVLEEYKPEVLAIETLYLTNNKTSGMYVSEARGVIMYECALKKLRVLEYTPPQIKVAVTGYGKADKSAVMDMVPKLIQIDPSKKIIDDEMDAIAVALTGIACEHL
jgi:crossover junction endodeoxyribonuclease RuvC